MMEYEKVFYPESRLGGFTSVDGTITFYSRVNALLNTESMVVDVGCGRGVYGLDPVPFRKQLRVIKDKCRKVIGIDVDHGAGENPFIDEFRPITPDNCWPVEDGSIDLCLCDNVLEHVEYPHQFFSECERTIKPGGNICIRTPNVLSYFGLLSKLVPNRQHTQVLKKVKDGVVEEDVFPTFYRCNTVSAVRRVLRTHGFEACVYGYDAEPSYLSFSILLYFLGVLHQRYAPGIVKVGIHAFGKKRK